MATVWYLPNAEHLQRWLDQVHGGPSVLVPIVYVGGSPFQEGGERDQQLGIVHEAPYIPDHLHEAPTQQGGWCVKLHRPHHLWEGAHEVLLDSTHADTARGMN